MRKIFLLCSLMFMVFSCSSDDSSSITDNTTNEPVSDGEAIVPDDEEIVSITDGNEVIPNEENEMEGEIDNEVVFEAGEEWINVFEENFDTNLNSWDIWQGGAFNDEIQLYNEEQLTVSGGMLIIKAERESARGATNPFDDTVKNFDFVSGRIETKEQFGPSNNEGEVEYRIVSSIKMPAGNGMWPAFWSYSDPWPTNGEIDIIEARGNQPNTFQSNIFYGEEANIPLTRNEDTEKVHLVDSDITSDFHEYELIWSEKSLIIKFDGEVLHTYMANSENYIASLFGKKQQVVLNLAVGGVFFPDADAGEFVDSSEMIVDWVKVYKR